ncbi:Disease resistance protein RGA2 [Spatholobus suberectus]|nr:Disease resistance protein RGA2 [Spatholobus suberectus]
MFGRNEELTCFPDGMLQNLTSLKKLEFISLPKLEILPTEIINLNAIQELVIRKCNSLKLLPLGVHSLKKLIIIEVCCKFDASAGFECLEYLRIRECREVEGLHEALQHMTALKELFLSDISNLESLPDCFGNLPLLRHLYIENCSKLTCLPTSLSLSNLEELEIYFCCPELKKRCEKETGEDWPKIAHVPHIIVTPTPTPTPTRWPILYSRNCDRDVVVNGPVIPMVRLKGWSRRFNPNSCFVPNGYPSTAYYYGGNCTYMYHQAYGYTSCGAYAPPNSSSTISQQDDQHYGCNSTSILVPV